MPKAEGYIDMCLASMDASSLVESVSEGNKEVRAFYDSGEICFCTIEDVMIEAGSDYRLDAIATVVNEFQWPVDFPLVDDLDGFEGTVDELFNKVSSHVGTMLREVATPVNPKRPRKKSLAQKQGARQGGRTRVRHAEGFGAIYYEYYDRQGNLRKV